MYRVLLAEDNKLNQIVAAGTLQKLGYEVEIVDGGADAVAACQGADFDVILMDVMMPDMDGYQATAEIRARELERGGPHTPVIGLSARAMDGDREIALGRRLQRLPDQAPARGSAEGRPASVGSAPRSSSADPPGHRT